VEKVSFENVRELISGLATANFPRVDLRVRIFENENLPAPLGLDVQALRAILYVGAVAELIYSHASYLANQTEGLPYTNQVLQEFEKSLQVLHPGGRSAWELYDTDHGRISQIFMQTLLRRSNGFWSAASSEQILRLELLELWKENPSNRKIMATGVAGAVLLLAAAFGFSLLHSEYGAVECRAGWHAYGNEQADRLVSVGKFEGKFPQEAYDKLQLDVNNGIAACGSQLRGFTITLNKEGTFIVDLHSSTEKKPS
jgi:hypothetical protein